ncbi:hypothetical protein vseg_012666 [Gypsophila vaccaria]
MAKFSTIRSTLTSCSKIIATNSKHNSSSNLKSLLIKSPIQSSFRLASALVSAVESQKPLHSAIASARLNSILALDSTCWSSLSIAFAVPR